MAFIHDVTERKQVEQTLSENKYRALFEHSTDTILITEGDKFVDCNPTALKMLGYDTRAQKELLETPLSKLSPKVQVDGQNSFEKANEMMSIAYAQDSHRFE